MTRRDFQLIADVIRETPVTPRDRELMAVGMAKALRGTNPRFDYERFLAACGVAS